MEPSAVSPGESLRLAGTGFAPGTQVYVMGPWFESLEVIDSAGGFVATHVIPDGAEPGEHVVVVTADEPEEYRFEAPFTVLRAQTPAPTVVFDPDPVLPGGTLHISGSGFAAAEVQLASTWFQGLVTVDTTGGFAADFLIPAQAEPGPVELSVTLIEPTFPDEPTGYAFTYTVAEPPAVETPVVTVSPSAVLPGQTMLVEGSGFPPSMPMWVGTDWTVGLEMSDADGNVSAALAIPQDAAPGDYEITISSYNDHVPEPEFSYSYSFTVLSWSQQP